MTARAAAAAVTRPVPVPPAVGEVVATWHTETCADSRYTRPFAVSASVWHRGWKVLEETGDVAWDPDLGVRTTNWPANTLGEALPALLAALARDVGSTAVVDLDSN